ncbi:hypothetical protein OMCYN_00087 [cyanobiont of Ornithocercus magnificus]|nr:hypothetical protein OMCYN_00087 [cyanobiont of Ornithocercus magnificus]
MHTSLFEQLAAATLAAQRAKAILHIKRSPIICRHCEKLLMRLNSTVTKSVGWSVVGNGQNVEELKISCFARRQLPGFLT